MKTKSSKCIFMCVLLQIAQGILTLCFDFFLTVQYSKDAPEDFYNMKFLFYFSISILFLLMWGYLISKIKSPKAIIIPFIPCLAWLMYKSSRAISHHIELEIAQSFLNLMATWLQCVSTCPLACINVFIKDTPTAANLSGIGYIIFLVMYIIVNRKRAFEKYKNP